MERSIELTIDSLTAYGALYKHWAIAFSGGKDSSATVTLVAHLLETGKVPRPESLTIIFADTRQELPPLHNAAMKLLEKLRQQGFDTRVVLPEMSMERELEALRQERGEKFLMLTGVRIGESAARDQRIAMSCTKDGGECGQGWFQHSSANGVADTLAPLLHWRVCHIWDWLVQAEVELGYPTFAIAEVYGHDPQDELGETEPMNARTGCIGCPLVQRDSALDRVVANPKWAYLAPLQQLRSLYWRIKQPQYRLRKHGELRKDGSLAKKQGRLGPLHLNARREILAEILAIQDEVNQRARAVGQPKVSLINDMELARIHELIDAETWPEKWDGTEHRGDMWLPEILSDGSIQPLLF